MHNLFDDSVRVLTLNYLIIPIYTVEELIGTLNAASPSEYAKIFKSIRIEANDLMGCGSWDKEGYTRNCLARTDTYELILLCWDIGAKTPIHGHGGEDCWVYQIKGTIEELRFKEEEGNLTEVGSMELHPGKLTYMHDRMGYHSLRNTSNDRAMTLHIYASPIDFCDVYNDDDNCFETKEMTYHTCREEKVESIVF